jgi:hypothetical protein
MGATEKARLPTMQKQENLPEERVNEKQERCAMCKLWLGGTASCRVATGR